MATNTVKTDKWKATGDPANVLQTDKWLYDYSTPIPVTLKTDEWLYDYSVAIVVGLKTDRWIAPFTSASGFVPQVLIF